MILYTDGACSGNPGPWGWWVVIVQDWLSEIYLSGRKTNTTNNEMELSAVIAGLKYCIWLLNIEYNDSNDIFNFNIVTPQKTSNILFQVFLDSQYVKNGIELWIDDRKKRGRKNSKRKTIANIALWQKLDTLNSILNIQRHWVKWHNNNHFNEIADKLATRGGWMQIDFIL